MFSFPEGEKRKSALVAEPNAAWPFLADRPHFDWCLHAASTACMRRRNE